MRYSIYYQFYEAVLRNPHNIALECAESTVTFIELYTKTIQAANVLRAEGVKKHDIVLLYMSNSIEYIIWMLAVLRMGAIVLPVDSTVPKQRTIEIIRESCPRIIICDDIINIQSVKWIGLQSYINEIATDENLPDQIDSLYSFCLYTSGSTGTSKGVLLKQEAICRHVKKKMELLQIDASSKMCTSFSISFVASIWILLAPLFTNAKLYIYNYDIYSNAHIFFNHVDTDAISIISVVPRFAGMYCKLIDNGHRKFNLSGLKYILLTGEKLDINIVHSFHSYYPKVNLVNAYGQTECSDDTFHFKIPYPFNNTDVPIGLPSEYIDTFILDTGELCLAGPCLFGRYLHEDFAHQAIIWIDECNKFMYKTGDIVTCRNDGLYYYIGRIDNQIKINGFRIYPEEIEREICAIPGINEAVIVPFRTLMVLCL